MAADLSEFPSDETESHSRSKRLSFAAMGHDGSSPLTSSPITAPTRSTPPHSALTLERPMLESFMTPSSASTSNPGMPTSRQFGVLDHDIAKFAQSPLARAANHDLPGRNSIANTSLDDLTQRLSTYTLARELPSSAPVTPPTSQTYYDPRSRASTLTETSPPLQPLQKDVRISQHFLTPPSEGQASPANLVMSQSLPVSRRNSNTDAIRMGQDLSVIYENAPGSNIYQPDHRKSSSTLSGAWTNTSAEATYVPSTHGYEEVVEQRADSVSSKHVFGMLKTEDGQFPFLSNLAESTPSSQQGSLPRGGRHASAPSWPSGPLVNRNHVTRSSYPEHSEHRDFEYRGLSERTSANPSPHPSIQRTPPKGHSPGRFDLNSSEFVPQGTWASHEDHSPHPRDNLHSQRSPGTYYGESNSYAQGQGFVPPTEYPSHGGYYSGPRSHHHHTYDMGYSPRHMESPQDNGFEYRQQGYFNRDYSSHPPRTGRSHKRYSSNDYERLVLSKSRIQDFATKIPDLCRDQNGCRHLQAELATRDEETIEVIYNGAKPYFSDLMSDPFGNYLCQKLLETCNDSQRTELVKIIAPTIVSISFNQHGTRAVQKLLDHLTLPEQIDLVREALRPDVVPLTKDLNGNHVIQKCLNRLDSADKQFIYDAVAMNCIEVATHKHGCCVFQRCIDHANDQQSEQLYKELIKNTIILSQDQFGNYVLQYILDKPETNLTPLIRQFQNHVVQLSKAKFSSNVIEKCVRVANTNDRDFLITEMVRPGAMAEMIDDNFANYVVQTALDYAEGDQRTQLIKEIMPLLSTIKSRSWYKRIMTKIGLGITSNGNHFDSSRHSLPQRQYDDGIHQRINSERGGLASMHGYGHVHGSDRSGDHIPPGFMNAASIGGHSSDRNGYRTQSLQSHTQQYGNFYPYGPRAPVHHPEYRANDEY